MELNQQENDQAASHAAQRKSADDSEPCFVQLRKLRPKDVFVSSLETAVRNTVSITAVHGFSMLLSLDNPVIAMFY